jgi:hypothetical protein
VQCAWFRSDTRLFEGGYAVQVETRLQEVCFGLTRGEAVTLRCFSPLTQLPDQVPACGVEGAQVVSQQLRRRRRRGGCGGERGRSGVRQVRDSQRGAQAVYALPGSGVLRQAVSAPLSTLPLSLSPSLSAGVTRE